MSLHLAPLIYWIILILSHVIHIWFKVLEETKADEENFRTWRKNPFNIGGIAISFLCSITMLLIGWQSFNVAIVKFPTLNLDIWVGVAVAFVGFGGSSLFLTLMRRFKDKVDKKLDDR